MYQKYRENHSQYFMAIVKAINADTTITIERKDELKNFLVLLSFDSFKLSAVNQWEACMHEPLNE